MHSITQQIPTTPIELYLNVQHLALALGYYVSTNTTNPEMGIN